MFFLTKLFKYFSPILLIALGLSIIKLINSFLCLLSGDLISIPINLRPSYEKQLEYQGKLHDAIKNLKAINECGNLDIKTNESSVIVNNDESKILSDEEIAEKYHDENF